MDIYHTWCDLKPEVSDMTFCEQLAGYMGHLETQGLIAGWRLTRRKLGLGAPGLGEFHIMIEVRDLAQLDAAFQRVASRGEPVEGFHFGVQLAGAERDIRALSGFPGPGQAARGGAVLSASATRATTPGQ